MKQQSVNRRTFIKWSGLGVTSALGASCVRAETPTLAKHGSVAEPARETPVAGEYDVVVCGAGPAGTAAAIAAARSGAKTQLLELHGCLGGIWTSGLLAYILDAANKRGLMDEMVQRIAEASARSTGRPPKRSTCCDPEIVKIVLESLCEEAGVRIQYHTRVCAARVDRERENRLTHVITESKSGRQAFAGKVFLDCTGDGDLGVAAGCRYQFGQPETGLSQPMSMICLLTGVEEKEVRPFYASSGSDWAGPKDRLRVEMERGGLSPSYGKPSLFPVRDGLFMLMANHEYGMNGTKADDVTAATLRARRELHQLIDGLRSLGGPWKNIRIVATPEQIGVREGRRLAGLYEVTADDLREGRQQADAVCAVTFPVDVHALDPKKEKGIEKSSVRVKPYQIPLRALIAKDVNGLMMAGRCISGDFIAHASYRVTGNAVAMGEAAGKIAAVAAKTSRLPQDVKIGETI